MVFTNEQLGYAVKLFDNADSGYLAFLTYAQHNQSNPHLPRFRGKVRKINDSFSVCRMEILNVPSDMSQLDLAYKAYAIACGLPRDEVTPEQANSKEYKNLHNTFLELDRFRKQKGVNWDLHDGNMMLRADTVVITDPFY